MCWIVARNIKYLSKGSGSARPRRPTCGSVSRAGPCRSVPPCGAVPTRVRTCLQHGNNTSRLVLIDLLPSSDTTPYEHAAITTTLDSFIFQFQQGNLHRPRPTILFQFRVWKPEKRCSEAVEWSVLFCAACVAGCARSHGRTVKCTLCAAALPRRAAAAAAGARECIVTVLFDISVVLLPMAFAEFLTSNILRNNSSKSSKIFIFYL